MSREMGKQKAGAWISSRRPADERAGWCRPGRGGELELERKPA